MDPDYSDLASATICAPGVALHRLLYNLACYALQEDKPKLLEAAALELSMGKKADQFLAGYGVFPRLDLISIWDNLAL